ncbi:hypothetical protein NLJ89_g8992 [Agrocybe chaxingu]|uniref:Uncharacterized protein n=1 Tax=Agrocybe chaxingu TaxID=84603 RepID=A0A9W8MTK3_9AGAR|nr:hypothetical protein NLJ89_g8992 [Agrocybe chaxingu]
MNRHHLYPRSNVINIIPVHYETQKWTERTKSLCQSRLQYYTSRLKAAILAYTHESSTEVKVPWWRQNLQAELDNALALIGSCAAQGIFLEVPPFVQGLAQSFASKDSSADIDVSEPMAMAARDYQPGDPTSLVDDYALDWWNHEEEAQPRFLEELLRDAWIQHFQQYLGYHPRSDEMENIPALYCPSDPEAPYCCESEVCQAQQAAQLRELRVNLDAVSRYAEDLEQEADLLQTKEDILRLLHAEYLRCGRPLQLENLRELTNDDPQSAGIPSMDNEIKTSSESDRSRPNHSSTTSSPLAEEGHLTALQQIPSFNGTDSDSATTLSSTFLSD